MTRFKIIQAVVTVLSLTHRFMSWVTENRWQKECVLHVKYCTFVRMYISPYPTHLSFLTVVWWSQVCHLICLSVAAKWFKTDFLNVD